MWCSIKQTYIVNYTIEVEYVSTCKATKEGAWLQKFLTDLEVILNMDKSLTLFSNNNGAMANSKESKIHKRGKHIEHIYHLIREIVQRGDV